MRLKWDEFLVFCNSQNGIKNFETIKPYEFKVFRFLLKNDKKPKFRPWVITKTDKNNFCCITISCTTRQDVVLKYISNEKAQESIVQISKGKLPAIFNETTFIDCNLYDDVNNKTLSDLKENIDWSGFKVINKELPYWLTDKLVIAIVNSPATPERVKNGFKYHYSSLFSHDNSKQPI